MCVYSDPIELYFLEISISAVFHLMEMMRDHVLAPSCLFVISKLKQSL